MRRLEALTPAAFHAEPSLARTLLCFVLVDAGSGAHAFCSAYDFGPWPLLCGVNALPPAVHQVRARIWACRLYISGSRRHGLQWRISGAVAHNPTGKTMRHFHLLATCPWLNNGQVAILHCARWLASVYRVKKQ